MKRIAVVGLGQIGGSLILGIRKQQLPYHITGIDRSRKLLRLLKQKLDASSTDWKNVHADLIILCLHYKEIIQYLKNAPADVLIMDVCSAKKKIMDQANARRLRFIGGHPMAGNERRGQAGWDENLFSGKPFFICPSTFIKRTDLQRVKDLIRAIGAKSIAVNPAEHDLFVAMTSQFPAFLSVLLAAISRSAPTKFRGPGYESMTRLARSSPELLNTFMEANGQNIRKSALQMRKQLDRLIKSLA